MKKIGIYLGLLFLMLIPTPVLASEITDKLYMDIQIEEDGSIFIREIAVLSGTYNGRLRNIEYQNSSLPKFNGTSSSFDGSDIYNGNGITDLKIYDIADKYKITFDSINKLNKQFTEVDEADKGDYGVYTKSMTKNGIDLQIYNPSIKATAFYMEYRVKDAVVVHNDVAELYWNLLGDSYEESVTEFEARISLPGEDKDLRVWLHGPLYGTIEKTSDTLATVKFINLGAYEAVSTRLMFDKTLVPNALKTSKIDGREEILALEQKKADEANKERERLHEIVLNQAKYYTDLALANSSLQYYNKAINLTSQLKDCEEKTELLEQLAIIRNIIEEVLIVDVENQMKTVETSKTKKELTILRDKISLLLEGDTKISYEEQYLQLEEIIKAHYEKMQLVSWGLLLLLGGVVGVLSYRLYKKYDKDIETGFHNEYYRDFPGNYGPGVLEYLMKHTLTTATFSATILDLTRRKVIKVEEIPTKNGKKKTYSFTKQKTDETLTSAEQKLLDLLFVTIGENTDVVTIDEIKNYGSMESKAKKFMRNYNAFIKEVKTEAEQKNFFATVTKEKTILIILTIVGAILLIIFAAMWENIAVVILTILLMLVAIVFISSKKYRTLYGKKQYQMWMAHKKFLLDFGRFHEKELPEIALWERYLVTATVLGCADQVQKSMKIHLESIEAMATDTTSTFYSDIVTIHMMNHLLNANIPSVVASTVSSAMSVSQSTIAAANSVSSSGGGFGGGASGGGGFGGGGGGGGRF